MWINPSITYCKRGITKSVDNCNISIFFFNFRDVIHISALRGENTVLAVLKSIFDAIYKYPDLTKSELKHDHRDLVLKIDQVAFSCRNMYLSRFDWQFEYIVGRAYHDECKNILDKYMNDTKEDWTLQKVGRFPSPYASSSSSVSDTDS